MSDRTTANKYFRRVRRIKSDKFSIDDLHEFTLSLMVGIRDFQICVTNPQGDILYLEDFKLENIKTINARLEVLKSIWDDHHFLKAGFWKKIKLALKSHKYTLVPQKAFIPESQKDYLAVNSEIKPKQEAIYHYEHNLSDAVNVFAGDGKLVNWVKSVYKNKEVEVIHQGSAFIEGALREYQNVKEPMVHALIDRGVLHIVVTMGKRLLYYNQFAARKGEEILKYTMLVYKELDLDQKKTRLNLWGSFKANNPHLDLLKKYIRHIEMGGRPKPVNFRFHQFDEVGDHQYFDLYNVPLCS